MNAIPQEVVSALENLYRAISKRPSTPPPPRNRRTRRSIDEATLLVANALLKHPGGIRARGLALELGLTLDDIRLPLLRALEYQFASKKGKRRGTRYFPLTPAHNTHPASN